MSSIFANEFVSHSTTLQMTTIYKQVENFDSIDSLVFWIDRFYSQKMDWNFNEP